MLMYVERNLRIIDELNTKTKSGDMVLSRKGEVARSTNTRFTSVGSMQSVEIGGELHLGLKERNPKINMVEFLRELLVVGAIADKIPDLSSEVPIFYAFLEGIDGNNLGVLTEDFTKGGTDLVLEVHEETPQLAELIPDLSDVIPRVFKQDLVHAMFLVGNNRTRRLGDFNTILSGMSRAEVRKQFPVEELYSRSDEFVVFVDESIHLKDRE